MGRPSRTDRPVFPGQSLQQTCNFNASGKVQKCGWLVQQHYGGLLGEGTGNHYPLAFPITQIGNVARRQINAPRRPNCPPDYPVVLGRQPRGPSGIRVTPQAHKFISRETSDSPSGQSVQRLEASPGHGCSIGRYYVPSISTLPVSSGCIFPMVLSKVDLPAPFGPSIHVNSP